MSQITVSNVCFEGYEDTSEYKKVDPQVDKNIFGVHHGFGGVF